jgi:hypothetical protein
MATKRQRRKRRRRTTEGRPAGPHATGSVSLSGQTKSDSPKRRDPAALASGGSDPAIRRAHRRPGDRPRAPWGSFPLSEIVVFIGIVVLIAGFFVAPPQGFVMIAVGLGLGSLAGLELSVREHFAGYRSHTLLLSAAIGVPIFGVLFVTTRVSTPICVAAGLVAFGGSAWLFTQAFRRRSGGARFRLSG